MRYSYDYDNTPLIKLICTKFLRYADGSEYIEESLHGRHVRYFFYPATEEYNDYFIMFSRAHKPIQFKEDDFVIRKFDVEGRSSKVNGYIKKSIITKVCSASEMMMTPLHIR